MCISTCECAPAGNKKYAPDVDGFGITCYDVCAKVAFLTYFVHQTYFMRPIWKVRQFSIRNHAYKEAKFGVMVYTEASFFSLFIINWRSNNQFFFVHLL